MGSEPFRPPLRLLLAALLVFGGCDDKSADNLVGALSLGLAVKDVDGPSIEVTDEQIDPVLNRAVLTGTTYDFSGVKRVEWSNSTTGGSATAGGVSPWTATVPLAIGDNVLELRAVDDLGNLSRKPWWINYDPVPPTVTIETPTTSPTHVATVPEIRLGGTATDAEGVTSLRWTNAATGRTGLLPIESPWTLDVALVRGDNLITVTASDRAGNAGTASLTVTLVGPGPFVAIDSPTMAAATDYGAMSPFRIAGIASDDVGVTRVLWTNAATGDAGDATGTGDWWFEPRLKPGPNLIVVTAMDGSGNVYGDTITVTLANVWTWNRSFFSDVPRGIAYVPDAIGVASGNGHRLVLLSDGSVLSSGANAAGQLGDGTTDSHQTFQPVPGIATAVAVQAGYNHSVALLADGTVLAWGSNFYGQLGNGPGPDQPSPVPVAGLSNVRSISAFDGSSAAVLFDGTVRVWGENATSAAAKVTNAVFIATGGSHTLAVLGDGTVRAWGLNGSGQLGDDTTTDAPTDPVQVQGLTGVSAVAAGASHSIALLSDGTLRYWGNAYGLQTEVLTPRVDPLALTGFADIRASATESIGMRGDGSVSSWGGSWSSPRTLVPFPGTVAALSAGPQNFFLLLR